MTSATMPDAIVDSHHHLWDLARGRYPWLQDAYDPAHFLLGAYEALRRDFMPEHYRAACEGLPVVATVHVEAERARAEALAETAWLHEVSARSAMPHAVVAWVDLLAADAEARLAEQAADTLVRGVRFKPTTSATPAQSVRDQPGALQDPRWPDGLARLQRHGLSWDLRVPFWHLEEAATLVCQAPGLAVALNHVGLPWDRSPSGLEVWRRGMTALAACGNVHVKLSELGLRDAPWNVADNVRIIREVVDIFGWQRCMFGSNFPVASLRIGYRALVQATGEALAPLTAKQRRAIWQDNALRFYRISMSTPGA
ncbi:MAG TPA: amidohydrolase family protein [Vineibacter sp.]|nr:amidohydrolase family protein [Vineibacter sp.]